MTIIAAIPILFALLGLVLYFVATNPKAVEIARLLFACGALVALLRASSEVIKIG